MYSISKSNDAQSAPIIVVKISEIMEQYTNIVMMMIRERGELERCRETYTHSRSHQQPLLVKLDRVQSPPNT